MTAASTAFKPLPVEGESARIIIIPVRYFGYIPILLWVWVAAWVVVEGFLAWVLFRSLGPATNRPPQSPEVMGALLGLSTLAGGFVAWRAFWVSGGREILELMPDRLTLRRDPGGREPKSFDRARIRNLRVGSYERKAIYPSWGRKFIGKEECYIAFTYDGRPQEIARGMSRRAAEEVVQLLRNG